MWFEWDFIDSELRWRSWVFALRVGYLSVKWNPVRLSHQERLGLLRLDALFMNSLIELDWMRVACAGGLMVLAIGISRWQKLGLEWNLAIASVRTLLQLLDRKSVV